MPGTATPAGIEYPPNASGKAYVSLYMHRGSGGPAKTVWADDVPPDDEHALFCCADDQAWFDERGDYWGIRGGGALPTGTGGERVAKFPSNVNPTVPWHGFPVGPADVTTHRYPSVLFVEEKWVAPAVVTRPMGRRIQKRKL